MCACFIDHACNAVRNVGGARRGILFKGGAHMENIAHTKVVAFDKTGTLTMGTPQVTDILTAPGISRE